MHHVWRWWPCPMLPGDHAAFGTFPGQRRQRASLSGNVAPESGSSSVGCSQSGGVGFVGVEIPEIPDQCG